MPKSARLLPQTPFYNPRLSRVGLEVMNLAELRTRGSGRGIEDAHRVEFLMVLLVTGGSGEHVVDFETLPLHPGRTVVVRPGEVQQWRLRPGLEGEVLLVDPMVIHPASTELGSAAFRLLQLDDWLTSFAISAGEQAGWRDLAAILRRELDRPSIDDLGIAFARELFLCMMLRLARSAQEQRGPQSRESLLYRKLQRKLGAIVADRPSVARIARQLRVSPSTLGRACRASVGRSVKDVIDRRVALEAQRLLVHSGATAAAIGEQLGFSEATNFLKFFKRQIGMTPEAFRRLQRPTAAHGQVDGAGRVARAAGGVKRSRLRLRPATIADLVVLRRWDEAPHVIASDPHDDWAWEVELGRSPDWREQLIAEVDGRAVGFVQIIDPEREESHYWGDAGKGLRAIDLWVGSAADLGQGYGTRMLELALARCFADPAVSAVLVDPLASNLRAHRFYERLGFRAVERRRFGVDQCVVYRLDRPDTAARQRSTATRGR
jgi:AraC-like DNA-binding protein/RimJ/RimL family protein N-acetyltransferase